MFQKQCSTCGKIFNVHNYRRNVAQYCSLQCRPQTFKKNQIPFNKADLTKQCLICNKEFHVIASCFKKSKYCSRKCYALSIKGKRPKYTPPKGIHFSPTTEFKKGHKTWNKKPKIEKTCLICKKNFQVIQSLSKIKYCSKSCYYIGATKPKPIKIPKINTGRFKKGKEHSQWKEEIIHQGYVFLKRPNHPLRRNSGCVKRARLVIEKIIGRYLAQIEPSHHVNNIRNDDRPENLMAFTSGSAHRRFHGNPNNVKPEEIIFDGRKLK